jgi:hypothetical protein
MGAPPGGSAPKPRAAAETSDATEATRLKPAAAAAVGAPVEPTVYRRGPLIAIVATALLTFVVSLAVTGPGALTRVFESSVSDDAARVDSDAGVEDDVGADAADDAAPVSPTARGAPDAADDAAPVSPTARAAPDPSADSTGSGEAVTSIDSMTSAGAESPTVGSDAAREAPDAQLRPTLPPAAVPAADSVFISVSGGHAQADLVRAWIESQLSSDGFAVAHAPEAARILIDSSISFIGERQLEFFGRRQTQHTVAFTMQAEERVSGGAYVSGPFATTVDYTILNVEDELRQATDELMAMLIRDLESRRSATR